MLCNYDRDSREYNELVERIKLLRRYIGDSIDAGKGVKTKPFPAEWKSWKRVPEEWKEEQKSEQWFLNNLIEKRKPYFFVYIYKSTMQEYKNAKAKLDKECKDIFEIPFNELKNKPEKTQEEKNFVKHYYNDLPVTKTPCIMNKIAWKIEDLELKFKYPKNTVEENHAIAEKLMSGKFKLLNARKEAIKSVYKDWKKHIVGQHKKNDKQISNSIQDVGILNETKMFEDEEEYKVDLFKDLFVKKLEAIVANRQELSDYLVEMAYIDSKDNKVKPFCWIFGYEGIIETLQEKKASVITPIVATETDGILYLGKYYRLGECVSDNS